MEWHPRACPQQVWAALSRLGRTSLALVDLHWAGAGQRPRCIQHSCVCMQIVNEVLTAQKVLLDRVVALREMVYQKPIVSRA